MLLRTFSRKSEPAPAAFTPQRRIGIATGLLSGACFGCMYFVVHANAGRLPATQITFCRSLFALVAVSPMAFAQRDLLFTSKAAGIWVRSAANALSIVCLAWNLQHTSIGFANVLFNVTPIVVLILGFWTGAIPIRFSQALCMSLVVVGSCLFYGGAAGKPSMAVWLGGLGGAVAAGVHYTMLERQSNDWSPVALIWPLSFISLPLMLALKSSPWLPPSLPVALTLLGIGMLCLVGQYLVIVSMRHAGLAVGTALVPSAIAFGVLIEAAMTHRIRPLATAGCLVYSIGLMPLVALKASVRHPEILAPE